MPAQNYRCTDSKGHKYVVRNDLTAKVLLVSTADNDAIGTTDDLTTGAPMVVDLHLTDAQLTAIPTVHA